MFFNARVKACQGFTSSAISVCAFDAKSVKKFKGYRWSNACLLSLREKGPEGQLRKASPPRGQSLRAEYTRVI
jgi:hypothetical protein